MSLLSFPKGGTVTSASGAAAAAAAAATASGAGATSRKTTVVTVAPRGGAAAAASGGGAAAAAAASGGGGSVPDKDAIGVTIVTDPVAYTHFYLMNNPSLTKLKVDVIYSQAIDFHLYMAMHHFRKLNLQKECYTTQQNGSGF